jgi:rhodanese-related sulfurtransferase
VNTVSVEEFYRIAAANRDVFCVDVRTPEEYTALHVPHAKCLMDFTAVAKSLHALPEDKTTPLYLICRSGRRSAIAGRELVRLGFENVFNVSGGMLDWLERGYPVESGRGILDNGNKL